MLIVAGARTTGLLILVDAKEDDGHGTVIHFSCNGGNPDGN